MVLEEYKFLLYQLTEYPKESKVLFEDLDKINLIKNFIKLPFKLIKKKIS